MTLALTRPDCEDIWRRVLEVTDDPNDSTRVYLEVVDAYGKYGEDSDISFNRGAYFDATFSRLLANLSYAGKTSEVFVECRDQMILTFRRIGVPAPDLEEMADEAIARFWRFQYAEKYNPVKSSWTHYLYTALSRMASTYWNKKNRTPTATGFSYQHHSEESDEGCYLEPYDAGSFTSSPETFLILEETLKDFERFLRRFLTQEIEYRKFDAREGGIRTFKTCGLEVLDDEGELIDIISVEKKNGIISKHQRICVIIPPEAGKNLKGGKWLGSKVADLEHAVYAFYVREGPRKCSRVELFDGRSILWDNPNIKMIQRNEDLTPHEDVVVERSILRLYQLLMRGNAQADVIASILKIGDSTVHTWVRTLERLFAEWWKASPIIPARQKWMADPQQVCRHCDWEHGDLPELSTQWAYRREALGRVEVIACEPDHPGSEQVEAHWCDLCFKGYMDSVPKRSILPFPWGPVRANQQLVDRSRRSPNSSPVKVYNL